MSTLPEIVICPNCNYHTHDTESKHCHQCHAVVKPEPYDRELVTLLVAACKDGFDLSLMMIAADRADEVYGEQSRCGKFLRWFGSQDRDRLMPRLLFTGSQLYGTPTEMSDVDWVFQCPNKQVAEDIAETFADQIAGEYGELFPAVNAYEVTGLSDLAIRIGPVNLICVSNRAQWATWINTTADLARWAEQFGPRIDRKATIEFFRIALMATNTRLQQRAKHLLTPQILDLKGIGV